MILHTVLLFLTFSLLTSAQSDSPWAWRCADANTSKCVKERKIEGTKGQTSLEACKLTCGPHGSLFPFPNEVTLGTTTSRFSPKSIVEGTFKCSTTVCPLLKQAFEIFKQSVILYHPNINVTQNLNTATGVFSAPVQGQKLIVHVSIDTPVHQLLLSTNESYTLNVRTKGSEIEVHIKAPTFFGARHALETLSQLIDFDEKLNCLQIVSEASIVDEPAYKYRGVILDTARNFIAVDQLKKIIDGMAYNKLNTFHWHVTDSQSFPLFISSLVNMTRFGAYSHRQIYKPEEVKNLVEYAKVRGIRVIPEFDAPAHVGHGWQWGPEAGLGKLVSCLNKQPWDQFCAGPPCGQLNIANPNIYTVISKIYKEMIAMFGPLEMFHYGGDEIFLSCWNTDDEILPWMKSKYPNVTSESYYNEWGIFQEKVFQLFKEANKGVQVPGILWTSKLTESNRIEKYLDNKKYIIEVWTTANDPIVSELIKKGYQIILTNYDKLYLDCGFSSWVADGSNWCSPYKGWQDVYGNDITAVAQAISGVKNIHDQILGSEVAIWTEQIDEHTIDARLWPRAAALGERLWSDPKFSYNEAESRMLEQRRRLTIRGIRANRLQPEWCRQNIGECPLIQSNKF